MSTFSRLTGGARELDLELLIMRVACALPFLYHGSAILFGAFGGPGPQGFAGFHARPSHRRLFSRLGPVRRRPGHTARRVATRWSRLRNHRHAGRDLHGAPPARLRHRSWRPRIRFNRDASCPRPIARRPWQVLATERPPRPAAKIVVESCFPIGGSAYQIIFSPC